MYICSRKQFQPTWRVPGNETFLAMRFENDYYLQKIAKAVPGYPERKTGEEIGRELCQRFVDSGLVADDVENWGCPVITNCYCRKVEDVVKVLAGYLNVDSISSDLFDALCNLVFLGEGPCPYCGGEVEEIEIVAHMTDRGDYWTPPSYKYDYSIYRCRNCGETFETKEEL